MVTVMALIFLGTLLASGSGAYGFVAPRPSAPVRPTWALGMSSLALHQTELSARVILNKARECAYADDACATEARLWLTRILEVESGCVSGTVAGRDVCDNVGEVAEIVAHLRIKADRAPVTPAATTALFLPAGLLVAALLIVLASTLDYGQAAIPFTLEEWVWAAKGGYVRLS